VAGLEWMATEGVVGRVFFDVRADVLCEALQLLVCELMEVEVSELVGAGLGERRPDVGATHRNGYRPRRWDTRAGEIELQIPKLRQGSCFAGFLKPRKRSEQALVERGPAGVCVRGARGAASISLSRVWGCVSPRSS
jgi:putative transposase